MEPEMENPPDGLTSSTGVTEGVRLKSARGNNPSSRSDRKHTLRKCTGAFRLHEDGPGASPDPPTEAYSADAGQWREGG